MIHKIGVPFYKFNTNNIRTIIFNELAPALFEYVDEIIRGTIIDLVYEGHYNIETDIRTKNNVGLG